MPTDSYVALVVVGLIFIIVFLAGRSSTDTGSEPPGESPPGGPPSGAELIEHLQRTLGIAVVIDSVDSVEAGESVDPSSPSGRVTIQATLMSGAQSTRVTADGPTESDAWAALARAAIAWRNSDFQHIPMWWGGG